MADEESIGESRVLNHVNKTDADSDNRSKESAAVKHVKPPCACHSCDDPENKVIHICDKSLIAAPSDCKTEAFESKHLNNVLNNDVEIIYEETESNCTSNTAVISEDGDKEQQSMKCNKILDTSPPNGFVKPLVEGNGLVKLAECLAAVEGNKVTVPDALIKCEDADSNNCDGASNLTTDSEECATPSTEKTHVSDSESACEEEGDSSSDTVAPLCDALAKTSIAEGDCSTSTDTVSDLLDVELGIKYIVYYSEKQMPDIMRLITKDLSEPYSIYTYRYFIHNWPKLCFLAVDGAKCCGAIVCKLDLHKKMVRRGYIAMLAVDQGYRRRRIGSHLVLKAIKAMVADDCDEVVLETEITNRPALHLYENLGFVRDKRLFRYYLNGVDALRLKLWLR